MSPGEGHDALHLDALTIFGLVSVTLMLVAYALEARSPAFVLAFAFACLMGSAYGFLQGAWPFGLVEAVWSAVAVGRWWRITRNGAGRPGRPDVATAADADDEPGGGTRRRTGRNNTDELTKEQAL